MHQLGRKEIDRVDHAGFLVNFDEFADAERLGKDNDKTGHDVCQHTLRRKANPDADDPYPCHQRRNIHAHLRDGEDPCESDDDQLRDPDKK